jgi:hypothetical protein
MKKMILAVLIFSRLVAGGQTGSEIFLFDLKWKNGQLVLSGGKNITNHKGYDNQPFFHPSLPVIYYSSANDSGRTDIKYYDYKKNETASLTITEEREYSPTVTPDGEFISCIIQRDNGAQDLGKYPISGGKPVVLINNLKVGYHAWVDKNSVLLFVLGDSSRNTLVYYTFHGGAGTKYTTIAANIGRSLHKIPGQTAMSFVQKLGEKEGMIKRFDPATGKISDIAATLLAQDQLAWLQNNIILMSDGAALFSYQAGKDSAWQPVIVEGGDSMLKGVTRLVTNMDNSKLAVVVSE